MQKETIITKVYDFLKELIKLIGKFPRQHRFLLGDRIQTLVCEILELLIAAYYSNKKNKRDALIHINVKLEQLRHYLRLCFDLGLYSSKKYLQLSQQVNEIGKMLGGWIKSIH